MSKNLSGSKPTSPKKMGRPKARPQGEARFSSGERVVWKSGDQWKTGTVICHGETKTEADSKLPPGYKIQYRGKETNIKKVKQKLYYVAADSPLFKPGFTVHSVPERHLQKEKESWIPKEEAVKNICSNSPFINLILCIAKAIHTKKSGVPHEIIEEFNKQFPNIFQRKNNRKITNL
jgi:hypothetical protein